MLRGYVGVRFRADFGLFEASYWVQGLVWGFKRRKGLLACR